MVGNWLIRTRKNVSFPHKGTYKRFPKLLNTFLNIAEKVSDNQSNGLKNSISASQEVVLELHSFETMERYKDVYHQRYTLEAV